MKKRSGLTKVGKYIKRKYKKIRVVKNKAIRGIEKSLILKQQQIQKAVKEDFKKLINKEGN